MTAEQITVAVLVGHVVVGFVGGVVAVRRCGFVRRNQRAGRDVDAGDYAADGVTVLGVALTWGAALVVYGIGRLVAPRRRSA